MRERVLATFVVAALGLAVFGLLKPQSPDPVERAEVRKTRFFIDKTHQDRRFDMVVVGDSRALRGVDPSTIAAQVPGLRAFNFAFHAGGLNPEIFHAAEDLLDPDSPRRMVLLVPTSLSLMDFKQTNSQFREYKNKPRDVVWIQKNAPWLAEWFGPVAPGLLPRLVLGDEPVVNLEQEFHDDGWIATTQTPPDDIADLTLHRERLVGHEVDQDIIDGVMAQVATWTRGGILVLGSFPPAYHPRVAMEDSMLGFDRADFRESFIRAGGKWLDTEDSGYETYDGSHLVEASARRYSRNLGSAIAHIR